MASKTYQAIVRKASDYIGRNLAKPITIPEIAKAAYCGDRHLRRAFKSVTGANALQHLLQLRIQRAKELLLETDLDISEIAFEVGYNSHTRFTDGFRLKVGVSPSAFRTAAKTTGEIPVAQSGQPYRGKETKWFSDEFAGTSIGAWWTNRLGEWSQRNGVLCCKGPEEVNVELNRSLPENFRVEFETLFVREPGLEPSDLNLTLKSERGARSTYEFVVGGYANAVGELRRGRDRGHWNADAVIKEGQWQKVSLALKDDTITVDLDTKRIFALRDPFPPAYSNRSRFVLGTWKSTMQCRNFEVYDLGFPTLVPVVRQGDSLYTAGLYDRARDFYLRQLEAGLSSGEAMELRYKVGMCHLQEGSITQARGWMDKVVSVSGNDFWAQQSDVALLEMEWRLGDDSTLVAHAQKLFENESLRDGVRAILGRACNDLSSRGFLHRVLDLRKTCFQLEDPEAFPGAQARMAYAGAFSMLNHHTEAVEHLEAIAESPRTPGELVLSAMSSLRYLYLLRQKPSDARRVSQQMKERTSSPYDLARELVSEAFGLRGQGKLKEAIAQFKNVEKQYPGIEEQCAHALLQAAFVMCSMGEPREARKLMNSVAKRYPRYAALAPGSSSFYLYVPLLIEGKYEQAGTLLANDANNAAGGLAVSAQRAAKAGILFELAGKQKRADAIWNDATRRYPPNRCFFYGKFAQRLAGGENDRVEEMADSLYPRSEMFYLVALLMEKRGNNKRCRELLKASVKEDPTFRWPAFLAQQKLRDP